MNLKWMSRAVALLGMGLVLLSARDGVAVDDGQVAGKQKGRANRLARESSPYLLLHAHNPVDWYPWGPEAFEKARKEGKMIFLSVGYSSCYWCHVMERKVFMHEEIAKSLNENFVCIKVDREERPDVDDIYMTALQVYFQAIGSPSSGGWPLSMFLTPEGKPIAGGTYFPPEDTERLMGFPTVTARLVDLWKTKREQMESNAEIITTETRRVMKPKLSLKPVEMDDKLVLRAFAAVASSFDPEFGGVDFQPKRPDGPKFPTPAKLIFVQEMLKQQPQEEIAAQLDLTLMHMACGGIRDHLGGGFHRYSVDRKWYVPHFEKMLYDQAQLADVYANAFAMTKKPLYKQVAEEILTFVEREMMSEEGAFFSGLDAETNGIEGETYVWEAREIDNTLVRGAVEFKEVYQVKELSDFEHGNVLRMSLTTADSLDEAARERLALARQKLLAVRNLRPKVLRDEKILASWNGLMIGAFARAGKLLNQPARIQTAERAAAFLLTNLSDSQGRLLRTYTAGKSKLNAYLDDYAFVVDGLISLHEATGDERWLKAAKQLQDDQIKFFRDEAGGGFFFTSHHHEELLARTKNCYDGVLPAGNSVSARNLIKLARLTNEPKYLEEARKVIELFASNLEQSPRGLTVLALAVNEFLGAGNKPGSKTSSRPDAAVRTGDIIQVGVNDTKSAGGEKVVPLAVEVKDPKPKKDELVTANAYLSTDKLPAGATCQLAVVLDVKEGWHINANPPQPDFLKPVTISFNSKLGAKLGEIKYPEGHGFKMEGEDEDAMVYEGQVVIRGTIIVPKAAAGQLDEMEIAVNYQACDKMGCRPPKTIKLAGKLTVASSAESVKPINGKLFAPKAK